jgi:2-polyprenyl-3-methyl-5-hydroxy-6-metoxy-1,4-benzoquinol methylase
MPHDKRYKPLDDVPTSVANDRLSIILERVRGKTVLDVGCTGTKLRLRHPHYQPLYCTLAKEAREILGVDIDGDGITAMKAAGFSVQRADAETMNLGRRFQLIVAGDVIEHLTNPGLFLTNMHLHLEDEGELIVTTPNPFSFKQGVRILYHNRIRVHPEHTFWFCPTVLKVLFEISGLEMTHLFWIQDRKWYNPNRWPSFLRPYWSPSFLAVAQKKGRGQSTPC